MASPDPQLALLDLPATSPGTLKIPTEQPASLMGHSASHTTPEPPIQNLEKRPHSPEGPPAAFPLCLVKVFSADVPQTFVVKEEQQEWRISKEQPDPDCPDIKQEQLDLWSRQEGDQLQGEHEDAITSFQFSHVSVKSEDDEEKPQPSLLQQIDPPASSSAEHMKTQADGEVCGGSQQVRIIIPGFTCVTGSDLKTSHSSEAVPEECADDCDKIREPQTDGNPLSCSKCGKTFGQKHNLQQHMGCHTGEKPFSCSLCGKRFTRKGNLNQHLKLHTKETPCSCPVCGIRFAQKGNLTQHMAVHARETLFWRMIDKGILRRQNYIWTNDSVVDTPSDSSK